MNTHALDELWNSAANRPDADAGGRLAAQFLARLRARRRFQALWLGWTFCALTASSVLAGVVLVRNGVGASAGAWATFALLSLPWIVAVRLMRAFVVGQTTHRAAPGLPLHAVLHAARVSNADERRRLVMVGTLFVVMTPLLALAVWQLHATGKASVSEAWSMALVFGVALGSGAAFVTWRFRRRLLPERRKIDALLHDLDDDGAPAN